MTDRSSEKPPVQCGHCGTEIKFKPGQLVGDPDAVAAVAQLQQDLKDLTYALFRSNIDWTEAAHACNDAKCAGECRYITTIADIVRRVDGGILR